tara:strand:- start:672 stop:1412 length:741 start_codon:yes stop_codon:yes gene_type:complete
LESNLNIPIKKSWGQNFINDKNTIDKIINIINPNINEHILEIGPGKGALTIPLAKKVNKITAIEIDPMLTDYLNKKKISNIEIKNLDFMDYDLSSNNKTKIVGNLPYYISSPIIFKLIESNDISEIIIMVQKELGLRICGKPNTKDYSRISIMCQTFCDVIYECNISKNIFNPKPKVDSCIIRLIKKDSSINIKKYSKFIKTAFMHRRKTLKNNLTDYSLDSIYHNKRPENITVKEYIKLYEKYSF